MANKQLVTDLRHVLNGIAKVAKAQSVIHAAATKTCMENSSIIKSVATLPKSAGQSGVLDPANASKKFKDVFERSSVVFNGVQQFANAAATNVYSKRFGRDAVKEESQLNLKYGEEDVVFIREEDLEGLYVQSLGVEVLQQNSDGRKYEEGQKIVIFDENSGIESRQNIMEMERAIETNPYIGNVELRSTVPLVPTPEVKTVEPAPDSQLSLKEAKPSVSSMQSPFKPPIVPKRIKPLSKEKPKSQLSESSKERKVPASRIGRLVSYGGLAAGLGFGAVSEIAKRSLGFKDSKAQDSGSIFDSSPFLTEANAQRIVDTLCRVRGAALKIGQIMSIQDNTMINPQLQKVFERVRHAADFMPTWQMEQMLNSEFGPDWRSRLEEFDDKPFAAASIGQVHLAKLKDKRPVAVKIQYPGVAQGIESDIDNLVSVLNVWNIIPAGVFADNVIEVAKRELGWEVNYTREAECAKKFRKLLEPYPDYYIPEVIDEFCTQRVYTTELIEGLPVDKCDTLDQETRDRISFLLLDLFFRELFEFRYMQTDPNWSNFLYNVDTKQIGLLDFGASRDYNEDFVDKYVMILKGAAENDRKLVLDYSQKIGFLTGYESKAMEQAHVDTVMILGEAFRIGDEAYDFGSQNLTQRIQSLVPVMVSERLCPPPEEVYSLHRKLSGMFLLCTKLKGKVACRHIFDRVWADYQQRKSAASQ